MLTCRWCSNNIKLDQIRLVLLISPNIRLPKLKAPLKVRAVAAENVHPRGSAGDIGTDRCHVFGLHRGWPVPNQGSLPPVVRYCPYAWTKAESDVREPVHHWSVSQGRYF